MATNSRCALRPSKSRDNLVGSEACMPLCSRGTSLQQRFAIYVRIAGLYMRDGNLGSAEEYLGRSSSVMNEISRAAEAEHPGESRIESSAELAYKVSTAKWLSVIIDLCTQCSFGPLTFYIHVLLVAMLRFKVARPNPAY